MVRSKAVVSVAAVLAGAGALFLSAPAAGGASRHDTDVTIVQGIPEKSVDVYVGMHKVASALTFGAVTTDAVAPGHYDISFRLHGMAEHTKAFATAMEMLAPRANDAFVLNAGQGGRASVAVFMNPTGHVPMGDGRVIVRNVAHGGAVDVYLNAKREEKHLAEGDSTMAMSVKAGMYSLKLDATGTMHSLVGPVHLTVKDGDTVVAYLLGSKQDSMLRVAVENY